METPASTAILPNSLKKMRKLFSPYGLVSRVSHLPNAEGEPIFPIFTGSLGNPGAALSNQSGWTHDMTSGNFDGAGGALTSERAAHVAIAESLERYSSCAWDPKQMVWATASELGEDAIPPEQWPSCSETELADPRSGLLPHDPKVPLRWVQGWSFTRNRPVYIPAVLVWLKNQPASSSERFVHPASTGCAAHSDPVSAVVNGLLEVVERDSIMLTWLQKMRLPALEFDLTDLTEEQRAYVERGRSENLRTLLFDATTDLGIPVVYGLQLSDHDEHIAQMLVATCETDPGQAVAKLHREAASLRIALRSMAQHRNTNTDGSTEKPVLSVVEGALLSGPFNERHKFDFLLEGNRPTHRLRDLPRPTSGEQTLPWLLDRLHGRGCEVVAVDLTTDEARQVDATVVKVLSPQLMPLSFAHHARYLAHPRLYQAPEAMGHPVRAEADINPVPQPFA